MADSISDPTIRSAPQRVFLTGEPGCGKTTVIRRVAELLDAQGFKVGGMISNEIRENGVRTGFSVEDITTHEKGILARVGSGQGPSIGRYTVNALDLDVIGTKAIQAAIENEDIIVVDELGPMELNSPRFIQTVAAALSAHKHVLGTIHKRASHPLVKSVKSNPKFTVMEVTGENRGRLPSQIVNRITRTK